MERWKIEAERLKLDEGKSWTEVAAELQHYFPDKTLVQVKDKIRIYIQRLPRFKERKNAYLQPVEPQIIRNKWTGDKIIRFGLMGDTQINSKYTQLTHLHKFYDICQQEGIDTVYHTGDMDEGEDMRQGHKYECYNQGADDHIDEIVRVYPQRKGITTHFITGNHDASIFKRVGYDIGPVIASRRSDMKYLGRDEATVMLTPNCSLQLIHPADGTAYAISYKIQKMIDAIQGGEKPNIMAVGHYHKAEIIPYRNVWAVQTGCFQAQTPHMKRNHIAAFMGGYLIEVNVDEEGTITRFKNEFIAFYKAIKDDYKNWR